MSLDEFINQIDADGLAAPGAATVAAFEAQHGLILPDDYRAFLAATPGGHLRGEVCFSLSGEADGTEIMNYVFGLGVEDYASLERRFTRAESDAIPQDLLPIMSDAGGNTVALVLHQDRLGEMVFLDHEVADEGRATLAEAIDWGYAMPFARSFTAMVTSFTLARG